jgi:hypothetical protein
MSMVRFSRLSWTRRVKKKQQEAEVGILLRVMKTCGYDAKLLTSSALSIML